MSAAAGDDVAVASVGATLAPALSSYLSSVDFTPTEKNGEVIFSPGALGAATAWLLVNRPTKQSCEVRCTSSARNLVLETSEGALVDSQNGDSDPAVVVDVFHIHASRCLRAAAPAALVAP